ncbi:MAG: hypothetical protein GC178_13590 [Flavobacteriales bacterium]|nr:hypothetical protein [Flavobacteriales bacterium]
MKHLKTTLLAFALLFSANALMAQEKHDYAVITHNTQHLKIIVSLNGEKAEEINIPKEDQINVYYDTNPGLKQVNKMEDDGWELFDTGTAGSGYTYVYYMRRKEQ